MLHKNELILNADLERFWTGKNVFHEVRNLKGQVVRDKEGRQTMRVKLGDKTYYRKLHTGVGWLEIIKNLIQGRLPIIGAANEWYAIKRLQQLNIHTLTPAAYGCRYGNPAQQLSFLITEELTDTISLAKYTEHWPESPPTFRLKKSLIEQVATITRTLHAAGINHRDLYICHFLLDTSASDTQKSTDKPCEKRRLFLVDLHRAQMRDKVPRRWLIKDLASIHFSVQATGLTSRDYLRFLRIYYQQPLRDTLSQHASLLKQVLHRSAKLYHRDLRKGLLL